MSYTISTFTELRDDILAKDAAYSSQIVTFAPTAVGLTATLATQFATAVGAFDTALQDLIAADAAYRVAVQTKNSARLTLVTTMREIFPMCYANQSVSNAELASILLAPRAPRSSFVAPMQPTNLVATPQLDGYVKFTWNRNGNNSATTFQLEQRDTDGEWFIIWSGGRRSATIPGFAAGVEETFRVIAVKGESSSLPSPSYTIYSGAGGGALRAA